MRILFFSKFSEGKLGFSITSEISDNTEIGNTTTFIVEDSKVNEFFKSHNIHLSKVQEKKFSVQTEGYVVIR